MISVVDDDESARASTLNILRSAGYEAQSFASVDDFLNSGSIQDTECLILDVRMPGTDGLELQRRLRLKEYRSPIILITAYDDDLAGHRAMEAGALDMLHKPLNAAVFLAAIERALSDERRSAHLPHDRLRELGAVSLTDGYIELRTVLTPDESAHFRECPKCIDELGNIVRSNVAQQKKKKNSAEETST